MKTADNVEINPAFDWVYVYKIGAETLIPSRVRLKLDAKDGQWKLPASYADCPIYANFHSVKEYVEKNTGKKLPIFS